MRRLSVLPAALTAAAFAYTNSAAAAAPEAPLASAAAVPAAPLAPVNSVLLQGHPGAPNSIDDVLLVPSASAGQKGASFEWSKGSSTNAYVLWDKYFAAAQHISSSDSAAQTLVSVGYMTPSIGFGAAAAYSDAYIENEEGNGASAYAKLSQIKLFGSMSMLSSDLYASLLWAKPTINTYSYVSNSYVTRTDSVMLQVGMRHAPAAGTEGFAWNGNVSTGFDYRRGDNGTVYYASLYGQAGYVFFTDGINFLPGVDVLLGAANAKGNPDFRYVVGAVPYLAISVPLVEHWTLAGGAKFAVEQTIDDEVVGTPSYLKDNCLITNTIGNVGIRYERARWAFEAQIANEMLSNPADQFAQERQLFYSMGFTVNLK